MIPEGMLKERKMAGQDEGTKKSRAPEVDEPEVAQGSKKPPEDVVFIHGRTEDGQGLEVLRKRGEAVYTGQMRPLEEGKAITGEVVSLRPRAESPRLFDVDVLHRQPSGDRAGPAQVASNDYRAGWKSIWGDKAGRKRQTPSKKALN
jgi:hypothetical protein